MTVFIDSTPPGASVYIDSKDQGLQGVTGDGFKVRLRPGPHRLLLELQGYRPLEQNVQIKRRERFSFNLERSPARLSLRTPAATDNAQGAEVFVDGTSAGTVPADVEVKDGSHLIEARKPGFQVFSQTVEIRQSESRTLMISLKAEVRTGSLLVAAAEGNVFVDGQDRGAAPAVIEGLQEGEHPIEVRRSAGEPPLWQGSARVVAGQQVRVQAQSQKATQTGSLLVMAPQDAEVVVDGTSRARANTEIPGLKPGQHGILVTAKGYEPATRVVEVEAGKQRVEKLDMVQSSESQGVGRVRVVMVSPVEGAQYYVNGRLVPEDAVLGERGIEVAAGTNVFVVRQAGVGSVTRTLTVASGAKEVLTVDLPAQGGGAEAQGAPPGMVGPPGPMVQGPPGPEGPMMPVPVGPGPEVQGPIQGPGLVLIVPRMQTSLSAMTNDPGRFTVDLGTGYPYFVDLGIQVGALRRWVFGLDAGVEVRSTFYANDVALRLRAQLFQAGPIVGGLNVLIGGGGGPRQRNEFLFEAGLPLTLAAGHVLHLTFRPYMQVYSDRLCPSASDLRELDSSDPAGFAALVAPDSSRCTGGGTAATSLPNAMADAGKGTYSAANPLYQEGGTGVLERFSGVRFFLQGALEISLTPRLNLWAVIEGAPGQGQRQSYTGKFNGIFPTNDLPLYGRLGVSFKF